MFTGIIEEVGRVVSVMPASGGARLRVGAERVLEGTREGDSISTDGVCLTAVRLARVRHAMVMGLLEQAWRRVAPRKLVAARLAPG